MLVAASQVLPSFLGSRADGKRRPESRALTATIGVGREDNLCQMAIDKQFSPVAAPAICSVCTLKRHFLLKNDLVQIKEGVVALIYSQDFRTSYDYPILIAQETVHVC